MTPDLQIKISQWRQKAIAGTLTVEEMVEAASALREGRKSAAAAVSGAVTKKAKAAGPAIDGNSLLDELLG